MSVYEKGIVIILLCCVCGEVGFGLGAIYGVHRTIDEFKSAGIIAK